jgi:hypothetical protein
MVGRVLRGMAKDAAKGHFGLHSAYRDDPGYRDKIPIFSVPRFANYEWAMATNQTLAPTLILSAKSIGQLLWDFVPFGRLVGP